MNVNKKRNSVIVIEQVVGEKKILLTFFHIRAFYTYALVMVMCPPVEGHGKLVRGDGAHDPVPLLLEGVGVQEVACQLSLQGWKQEEV